MRLRLAALLLVGGFVLAAVTFALAVAASSVSAAFPIVLGLCLVFAPLLSMFVAMSARWGQLMRGTFTDDRRYVEFRSVSGAFAGAYAVLAAPQPALVVPPTTVLPPPAMPTAALRDPCSLPPGIRTPPARNPGPPPWVVVAVVLAVGLIALLGLRAVFLAGQASDSARPGLTRPTTSASSAAPAAPFVAFPAPPVGFEGPAPVMNASGRGGWDSPAFTLSGGGVRGSVETRTEAAYFYLVPAGETVSPGTAPTASCQADCVSGWSVYGEAPPAGRYYLHVVSAPAGTWSFDLTETFVDALKFEVTTSDAGASSIHAHGNLSQESAPFTFVLAAANAVPAGPNAGGDFRCNEEVKFYLVPVGEALDPVRDLVAQSETGASGGWVGRVPASGRYQLVVRTKGEWYFNLVQ
jgi:hypothetical protein